MDLAEMNRFSIRDIENLTGIKAHTIRIWEQRYGILQPKRTPTNIRYYDALDLKSALRIALLNQYGYKISRIHQMNEAEIDSLIQKINDRDFRLQIQVNELLEATLDVDIEFFEERIDHYIRLYGIENAVETLIFNFLEKIGIMWMTDRIFPAQEHLISNVIYRKISLAIEKLPIKSEGAKVLLFLPEGEIHDLALLYVYYLLKKYGKSPIYLGPNSPIKEVEFVAEVKKPEYVYLHLTSVASEFDVNKYVNKIEAALPQCKLLVSGTMLQNKKLKFSPNTTHFHNLQEVKEALIRL